MLGLGWVGGTSPFACLNENAVSVMSYDSCLLFLCHALAIRFLLRGEIPRRRASCEDVLAHFGGGGGVSERAAFSIAVVFPLG
jgi:hypothetical protein